MHDGRLAAAQERLRGLEERLRAQQPYFIGFPAAHDYDYRELYGMFDYFLNNVGDPEIEPLHGCHTKELEREVVQFFAMMFRAPADHWGYVTSGSTEGNLYSLYAARERYPNAVVYYSRAAHYSIPKNAHLLRLPVEELATQASGEMDYSDLRRALRRHGQRPAIVVANIGTTMTEAKDDVAHIGRELEAAGVSERYVHSDAAMAGAYAAWLEPRPAFDFADGADCVSVSGYKFIGAPMACGVVVIRRKYKELVSRAVAYTGTPDVTIAGSRSGHTPLLLWYALQRWGVAGLRTRLGRCLELAEYAETRLRETGWEAWRNPQAITVVLREPPPRLVRKWQLATSDGWSHVICVPGLRRAQIDAFVADLRQESGRSRSLRAGAVSAPGS
jgi:histidine decarboxylase